MEDGAPITLPKPLHVARQANRLRQKLRPEDPTDLDFELEEEHIADHFFRKDVQVRERRHLIFATDEQLRQLGKAKSWYIDGTFKLCRLPFSQLLSINAFVRKEDCAKQVPLLFVLMSGRIWPTSSWSVFMQSVRTNNDLEGWHRGLNSRASGKSGLPFYLLVKFLYREARLTSLQMRLVSERKLKRIQRRQFRNLQTKIFNLWEEFRNGERSAKQLLSAISYLIAPNQ